MTDPRVIAEALGLDYDKYLEEERSVLKDDFDFVGEPFTAAYRHNKEPKVHYVHRSDCVRAMARTGGRKMKALRGGRWILIDLYEHEKQMMHALYLQERQKARYARYNKK